MEAIEVQQGILVERARDAFSFSHLTFQEYLTAQHIVDNQQITWLVTNHLTDERWKEVFLLVAGLIPGRKGADQLLELMERQAQRLINHPVKIPKLMRLLQWAEQATSGSNGSYKPAAKRAAAIYLARALDRALDPTLNPARALAFALDSDLDLDLDLKSTLTLTLDRTHNRILKLARFFAKINIFRSVDFRSVDLSQLIIELETLKPDTSSDSQTLERQTFIKKVRQLWLNALQLDSDIVTLSEEEVTVLAEYLCAAELMIRCKEAAVRISPEVWQGIEERILLVRTA